MYVCMYVCMCVYVCMYVCMYIMCMYVCIYITVSYSVPIFWFQNPQTSVLLFSIPQQAQGEEQL